MSTQMSAFFKSLRPRESNTEQPLPAPVMAQQYVLDVLRQGRQAQQLTCVKEVMEALRQPGPVEHLEVLRPVLSQMLAHEAIAVRTLFLQKLGDTLLDEATALWWIERLEQYGESNRLLRLYRLELLQYMGEAYGLHGHVIPLVVQYIHAPEEDLVEAAFALLLHWRNSGHAALIDPLMEALRQ